jgi:hypothetical protein
LKPYTATVTAGPAGLGTSVKLLLIVSVTLASSLILVSPQGRTVEQPANATIANPNTSTIANPSHLYAVGNYSISFNATTDKGCFKDTIVNTSFNLKPSLAFGSIAPICGSAATISVANGSVTNGVPGTGSYGGPGTDAAGNFNPIIAGAGLHTIWYYYATTGGCRDSVSQTIQVRAKPNVAFGYTNPVCLAPNGLVQFTNSSSVSDGQTISYNWDFNDPFANAGNSNTSTLITPSHNFGEGVFNIKLSATTNFGCVNDSTIAVTFSGGISKWSGLMDVALESGHVIKPSNGWYQKVNRDTGEVEDKKFRLGDTDTKEFWIPILKTKSFQDFVKEKYTIGNNVLIQQETLEEIDDLIDS